MNISIVFEYLNENDKFIKVLEEKIALSRNEVKEALKKVDELNEMMTKFRHD